MFVPISKSSINCAVMLQCCRELYIEDKGFYLLKQACCTYCIAYIASCFSWQHLFRVSITIWYLQLVKYSKQGRDVTLQAARCFVFWWEWNRLHQKGAQRSNCSNVHCLAALKSSLWSLCTLFARKTMIDIFNHITACPVAALWSCYSMSFLLLLSLYWPTSGQLGQPRFRFSKNWLQFKLQSALS